MDCIEYRAISCGDRALKTKTIFETKNFEFHFFKVILC